MTRAQIIQFGDVTVDLATQQVARNGKMVDLSAREFKLLRYFIEHPGTAITRDELLTAVWGYESMPFTRTVDVHIAWLRQKIEAQPHRPQFLLTVHGVGYRFVL
jgi:two-component system alkaline phosphatase synthesis response regulator PhoP